MCRLCVCVSLCGGTPTCCSNAAACVCWEVSVSMSVCVYMGVSLQACVPKCSGNAAACVLGYQILCASWEPPASHSLSRMQTLDFGVTPSGGLRGLVRVGKNHWLHTCSTVWGREVLQSLLCASQLHVL